MVLAKARRPGKEQDRVALGPVLQEVLVQGEIGVTIRVGYVGVHIATYYAEEHRQIARARTGLSKLAEELGFELVVREGGVINAEQATAVAHELAEEHLDLLIVQTAACCMADALLPFADLGLRLGIWATPEPRYDGDIQLNSLVTANIFTSTLRRYYRTPKPFKWFFGHVEEVLPSTSPGDD